MYENKIAELEKEHADFRTKLIEEKNAEVREKAEFEEKLEQVTDKFQSLQFDYTSEVAQYKEQIEAMNQDIKTLEESLQDNKDQFSVEIDKEKIKLEEKLAKEKDKMQRELESTISESEKAKQDYKEICDLEKKAILQRSDKLSDENKKLSSHIQVLESEGNFVDHTPHIEALKEEMKIIKKRAKEDINMLQTSENRLLEERKQDKITMQNIEKQLKKCKGMLKSTQEQVEFNKDLKDDSVQLRNDLEDEINRLKYMNKQKDNTIYNFSQREASWSEDISLKDKEHESDINKLRDQLIKYNKKVKILEENISKQKDKEEKLKSTILHKKSEMATKNSELSRQNNELKKEIRRLHEKEIDKTINTVHNQSYNVNESINMRVTKSQLNLNDKTSETVLYGANQDNISENSILESLNKYKHKRRPSSVSSAERVLKNRQSNAQYRDCSPNYETVSYLEDSYISKSYINENLVGKNAYEDFQPEKDITNFTSNVKEAKQISTSYLDDDYEEEQVPRTHRESRNSSRYQKHRDHSYKPSPVARGSSSTQNLIGNRNGKISQNTQMHTYNSNKRIIPKNTDTLENVLSPDNFANQFRTNDLGDHRTYDLNDHVENDIVPPEYFDQLETTEPRVADPNRQRHIDSYSKSRKTMPVAQKPTRGRRDFKDIIDSQTHNTFDNGEYQEDGFALKLNYRNRNDNVVRDLNNTYDDKRIKDTHDSRGKSKETNRHNRKMYEQEYPSRESIDQYAEDSDVGDKVQDYSINQLEQYDDNVRYQNLKKAKSRNNLKTNFDRCQKFDQFSYNEARNANTQQSFREYQPKQTNSSKNRKHQADHHPKIARKGDIESYPTFNDETSFLNETEIPSKAVEKQLRTKSMENNRRIKRSRMGNYLCQVPKNHTNRPVNDVSPNHTRDEQYMTHQMISVHDQIENDHSENQYKHTQKKVARNIEYKRVNESVAETEKYMTSPHIVHHKEPDSSQNRYGKSSSRNKIPKRVKKPSQGSFQENVPENVMRNKQNHTNDQYSNSRNSKKHMDLLNVLKEREAVQAKHNSGRGINDGNDYNDVDDTFTYSMEPESMLNSNILGHNN